MISIGTPCDKLPGQDSEARTGNDDSHPDQCSITAFSNCSSIPRWAASSSVAFDWFHPLAQKRMQQLPLRQRWGRQSLLPARLGWGQMLAVALLLRTCEVSLVLSVSLNSRMALELSEILMSQHVSVMCDVCVGCLKTYHMFLCEIV